MTALYECEIYHFIKNDKSMHTWSREELTSSRSSQRRLIFTSISVISFFKSSLKLLPLEAVFETSLVRGTLAKCFRSSCSKGVCCKT